MTEAEARRIAEKCIAQAGIDSCKFESIRRFEKESNGESPRGGNEWAVTFVFDLPDDVASSSEAAIVVVDDATGKAHLCDSL